MNESIIVGERYTHIEIKREDGKVETVDAWIFGQVAVHKQHNTFGVEAYTISHIKTGEGVAALRGLYSYGACVEWAEKLAQLDLDKYLDDYHKTGVIDNAVWKRLGEIMDDIHLRHHAQKVILCGYRP